jgi:Sec7-like guanine-nucleotide exchange factor
VSCAQLTKYGLDGMVLGEFLSKEKNTNIMKTYVSCIDFRGLNLVDALRRLFVGFKPVGEVPGLSDVQLCLPTR